MTGRWFCAIGSGNDPVLRRAVSMKDEMFVPRTHRDLSASKPDPPPGSGRNVNYIASWWRPEINPAGIVSQFFLRCSEIVAPAPRDWYEARVVPPRLDPRAVPATAIV